MRVEKSFQTGKFHFAHNRAIYETRW